MLDFETKESYGYEDLIEIMRLLRAPGGCPWDAEQTHQSIRRNLLEEAYEAAEAIDLNDRALLCEELGDVLLQVVFHARMEEEAGGFSMPDVCDGVCRKLILRHPHIFGDVTVSGTEEVLKNWDDIKRDSKGQITHTQAMESVAKSLPALIRAEKIQTKAKKAGFDWEDVSGSLDKVSEELEELKAAVASGGNVEEELGDLLFSAVNVSRFLKVDAEQALERANEKFIYRFRYIEEAAGRLLKRPEELSAAELEKLWEEKKSLDNLTK